MLECDDLVGLGMAAHQLAPEEKRSPRGHLPDRPQYQLHEFLHRVLFLLRVSTGRSAQETATSFSFEEIYKKIDEMLELWGTGILLQERVAPGLADRYTKIYCAP